ncbi:MAG: phosphoenolpyruvate--protein phosphotransferase [Pirellulaceae bacterium]|nr:phosphoenolpyruvate--protein phosphotransferase [Pirellulaceae bacterium]
MLELQGIAVSPGVAIGMALVFDREGYQISRSRVAKSEAATEWQRLQTAIETASARLQVSAEQTSAQLGSRLGGIFSAQKQMLLDGRLHDELRQCTLERNYSAEFAISEVLNSYAAAFRRAKSSFLAERASDIRDIERLVLEALSGAPTVTLRDLAEPAIIASHDLTPGETAGLDTAKVLGLCTETGGPGGHTSIVARGMEIPAVVGIGSFLHLVGSSESIIVDGHLGRVIINPDEGTREKYLARRQYRQSIARELTEIRHLPACTSDNVHIQLMANIEFPHETNACLERGADGVGLYRTEFLYLSSETEPSEEEHFQAYVQVAREMTGKPVVMRTLDLGADKMGMKPQDQQENNPFLGLRSIRLSLRNPALFRTQVRAMLRAAMEGDVRIMFPMITTLDELRNARFLLRSVAEDLKEEGFQIRSDIPIGMMVEVPAAVMMLDRFVQEVDFVSIGTNDLTQYTLAVDRGNEAVADLYQACDPAVLRLIQRTWEVASRANVPTSVCGEMSNQPALALLLVGMGIRILSVAPSAIPVLKKAIRSVTIGQCQAMAWRAMQLGTAREVDAFLQNQLAGLVPEMVLQA